MFFSSYYLVFSYYCRESGCKDKRFFLSKQIAQRFFSKKGATIHRGHVAFTVSVNAFFVYSRIVLCPIVKVCPDVLQKFEHSGKSPTFVRLKQRI